MQVDARACTLLTMEVARLQGRIDVGVATDQETMCHRILTPILKLFTAKQVYLFICALLSTCLCVCAHACVLYVCEKQHNDYNNLLLQK